MSTIGLSWGNTTVSEWRVFCIGSCVFSSGHTYLDEGSFCFSGVQSVRSFVRESEAYWLVGRGSSDYELQDLNERRVR